ncbi:MAG: D-alanyl-D-alanine carboxypeptidase [Eubacterium sp.]|nr:D-alanyl-D-alanine carboxypeptidase [Eubacterium sp.]
MKAKKISRLIVLILVCSLIFGGCGKHSPLYLEDSYQDYYKKNKTEVSSDVEGMAEDLAVISPENESDPDYHSNDYANLLVNDTRAEVVESYRCFEKIYPASTTKIMTALLTLEHADFDDKITLDHNIVLTEDGAVISTLSRGDTVTVDEVFHTMLIKSANDCAVILAEYLAGSVEAFADMMNEKARELGATHTHFVNPNGLHDDDHYSTAYDLYLIFRAAVQYDKFVNTVSMKDYQMTYINSAGQSVGEYMTSTNHYLVNEYPVPEGVIMYGGKTGTTTAARSCLILMTENENGERFFSLVLGAKTKGDLYESMTNLLEKTVN